MLVLVLVLVLALVLVLVARPELLRAAPEKIAIANNGQIMSFGLAACGRAELIVFCVGLDLAFISVPWLAGWLVGFVCTFPLAQTTNNLQIGERKGSHCLCQGQHLLVASVSICVSPSCECLGEKWLDR